MWCWRRGFEQLPVPVGPLSARAHAGFCLLPSLPGFSAWAFSPGKYHCPVLFTVFTNNTHIVAVRTTGNVYAYEVGSWGLCGIQALGCVPQGNPGLGVHQVQWARPVPLEPTF